MKPLPNASSLFVFAIGLLAALTLAESAEAYQEDATKQKKSARPMLSKTEHAVLLSPDQVRDDGAKSWREKGYQVVLLVDELNAETETAANEIKLTFGTVEYFFEVGRSPKLADRHPNWMASVQGHSEWRRLFPKTPRPKKDEVVKVYPWVPVFYKEAFNAHLERIKKSLAFLPRPGRIWLNDIQGAPTACGCGHPLCRWTADYGPIKTGTTIGDSAPADFVKSVQLLDPTARVIPIMTSECEKADKDSHCGGVGCFEGICWKAFTKQLDLVSPLASEIGVACFYKEFGRDLKRYGGTANWTKLALRSFEEMPKKRNGKGVAVNRLVAVLQGWGVTDEELTKQIEVARSQSPAGILVCKTKLDQSWKPKLIQVESK